MQEGQEERQLLEKYLSAQKRGNLWLLLPARSSPASLALAVLTGAPPVSTQIGLCSPLRPVMGKEKGCLPVGMNPGPDLETRMTLAEGREECRVRANEKEGTENYTHREGGLLSPLSAPLQQASESSHFKELTPRAGQQLYVKWEENLTLLDWQTPLKS